MTMVALVETITPATKMAEKSCIVRRSIVS